MPKKSGIANCGEPQGETKNQSSAVIFCDTAIFQGIIDEAHVALELINSPRQYDLYSAAPEVMQLLRAANFKAGKQLLVRYRVNGNGCAQLEELLQQGPGGRLHITAGVLEDISPDSKQVAISNSGELSEYSLDRSVWDSFRGRFGPGQPIVAYYRTDGYSETIVAFEQS